MNDLIPLSFTKDEVAQLVKGLSALTLVGIDFRVTRDIIYGLLPYASKVGN